MKAFSIFSRFAATATLAAMTLFSPLSMANDLPADSSFIRLDKAQQPDNAEQTEVLEFFSYSCPYCAMFNPHVDQWTQTLPDNVVLKRVPVAFNAGMGDLQRMYFTLEALDRLDLHTPLFDALHQEKQRLFDEKALTEWAVAQGIDKDQFSQTFNSFGVQTKATRANELTRQYQIEGTPTLAVGGRFLTSPAMAQGYEQAIEVAQQLVDYSLQN